MSSTRDAVPSRVHAVVEAILAGFSTLLHSDVLASIIGAVIIGLIIGVIPGIGGVVGLALSLPLVYSMDPSTGLIILLALHSVVCTGGSISAILLNVPGTASNAATVIDGFPMTQHGQADRAIGAALTASALGGVFGAVILAGLIPVLRPIVLAFGAPEIFFLMLVGISFIAVLGTGSMTKGLIAGALGLLLSFFGYTQMAGIPRYSFGIIYLYDGFRLIPLVLGLFALPEVLEMAITGGSLAKVPMPKMAGRRLGITANTLIGIKDVFRRWGLFLRCSVIGTVIGIIPGVGGETAPFIAYGHAKQLSKERDRFGQGCVEGVIAPEGANNAKEGGALMPTLGFGVPGSTAMAVLLAAFFILGLEPGPLFLRDHLDMVWSMVLVLIVANLLGACFCLFFAGQLGKISFMRGHVLAPLILIFCLFGTYCTQNNILDVLSLFIFGGLGYVMKVRDYNRPALLLGFVLGSAAERYFRISLDAYGALFFVRPICLVLLGILITGLASNWIRRLWKQREENI